MSDNDLLADGMNLLRRNFGPIDAARFVSLIIKEQSFDYTVWRQSLFEGMTIEEISNAAMESYEEYLRNSDNK
jgi:hypothetical protein